MDVDSNLSDIGRRWLEYHDEVDNMSVEPERLLSALLVTYDVAPPEVDWLSNVGWEEKGGRRGRSSLFGTFCMTTMLYPVYCTERYSLGRMENALAGVTKIAAPGCRVVEERFYFEWDTSDPIMYFSVLMSNGVVLMMRRTLAGMFGGASSPVVRFSRDRPSEKTPVVRYQKRIDCVFCSAKQSLRCECEPKMRVTSSGVQSSKSQQVKHLFQDGKYSTTNWNNLCYVMTASTPFHFHFFLNPEQTRQALSLPDSTPRDTTVDFIMQFNGSVDDAQLHSLKMRHIQSFLQRATSPYSDSELTTSASPSSPLVELLELRGARPCQSEVSQNTAKGEKLSGS